MLPLAEAAACCPMGFQVQRPTPTDSIMNTVKLYAGLGHTAAVGRTLRAQVAPSSGTSSKHAADAAAVLVAITPGLECASDDVCRDGQGRGDAAGRSDFPLTQ